MTPVIDGPPPPTGYDTGSADPADKFMWETEVQQTSRKREKVEDQIQQLYSIVLGQCTDAMVARIEAHADYMATSDASDGVALLVMIKSISFYFHDQKYAPQSIHEQKRLLFSIRQSQHETVTHYYERFHNSVQVLEHCGGSIGTDPGVVQIVCDNLGFSTTTTDPTEVRIVTEAVHEYSMAAAFLLGADPNRFGTMLRDYENGFTNGRDEWPKTLNEAHRRLVNWKAAFQTPVSAGTEGLSFGTNSSQQHSEKKPSTGKGPRCWNCQEYGHVKTDCPTGQNGNTNTQSNIEEHESGKQMLANAYNEGEFSGGYEDMQFLVDCRTVSLNIGTAAIPNSWILLDNQSTVDVFANKKMLHNVRQVPGRLRIHTQAGVATTNWKGDLRGYGTVWLYEDGIANILALHNVCKKFKVTYDSSDANTFVVQKPCGNSRYFRRSAHGLFYWDTKTKAEVTLVNTVAENKTKYSNQDYSQAVLARTIQRMIGRPSLKSYLRIIETRQLKNCPIHSEDVLAAEDIFGPDIGSLKGKTVRKGNSIVDTTLVPIPAMILEKYKSLVLAADIMKVNKIPFLISISRAIKFGTVTLLANQKMETVLTCVKQICAVYAKPGFKITTLLMDGEFDSISGPLAGMGITLNMVSRGEHVPEAERRIRTIKERTRSVYNALPFPNKLPVQMVVQLIYSCNFWLNVFPPAPGVSNDISPRELVTGMAIDYNKHCRLEYGTYVQVHEEHDNTMATRTTGAIALRPSGNSQGGYLFFSLKTGRILNHNHWTSLPMPAEAIARLQTLGRISMANLQFTDKHGIAIEDADAEYNPDDDNNVNVPDQLDNDIVGVNDEEAIR